MLLGDAPLLKEFEISSREAAFYPDWPQWLPSLTSAVAESALPKLQSLTLQFTPFKWTSPMFQSGLHTLNLRALPALHISLDRVFYILQANQNSLHYLSFHFQGVTPAVLPLSPLTLPELKELSIGGSHILTQIVDCLSLPMLSELNIDMEPRDPLEETIHGLMERSGTTLALKHLSVSYGFGCGRRASRASKVLQSGFSSTSGSSSHSTQNPFFYGHSSTVVPWSLLNELSSLESLRLGGTSLEGLFMALGVPDDDFLNGSIGQPPSATVIANGVSWICPNLRELGLKNCHAHSEAVGKLVQMVEARNPGPPIGAGGPMLSGTTINGVAPKRLEVLELYECTHVGPDVIQWLGGKVPEVIFSEPSTASIHDRFAKALISYPHYAQQYFHRSGMLMHHSFI